MILIEMTKIKKQPRLLDKFYTTPQELYFIKTSTFPKLIPLYYSLTKSKIINYFKAQLSGQIAV